jgi:hypothetical protein
VTENNYSLVRDQRPEVRPPSSVLVTPLITDLSADRLGGSPIPSEFFNDLHIGASSIKYGRFVLGPGRG